MYQPDEVSLPLDGKNLTNRWDLLKYKVQSTMLFGPDFSALVDVLAAYENARKTEVCS